MTASWEMVAHVLSEEPVTDVALASRLDCPPEFVAGVRENLGMPPLPGVVPPARRPNPLGRLQREKFARLAVVIEDGHREWRGRYTEGTPIFNEGLTAYRIAFRLEHGEEPVGHIRVECGRDKCVEGLHLSDRLMRERAAQKRGAGR